MNNRHDARETVLRALLIAAHLEHVRAGKYEAARGILRLLMIGRIRLGVSDTDWYLDRLFARLGLPSTISSRGWTSATYYIPKH